VKKSVKEAVNFIGAFEEGLVRFAREANCDGVVCGHIHTPVIREIDDITYYNTGDWVESSSALLEYDTGKLELITNFGRPKSTAPHELVEISLDILLGAPGKPSNRKRHNDVRNSPAPVAADKAGQIL
jgi:hypothetical protein